MAQCKHFNVCGLEEDDVDEDGYCVLHSPNLAKDQADFDAVLQRHREKRGHNYRYVVFIGNTVFDDVEFETDVSFRRATFIGEASFFQVTFSEKADFHSATFSEQANFKSISFSGLADFRSATFSGEASFRSATFSGEASFHSATFRSVAYFSFSTFSGVVSFSSATFNAEVYFRRATFSGEATFRSATFSGEATFRNTTFSQEVYFNKATFNKGGSFRAANFGKQVSFSRARFGNRAYFIEATFNEKGDFNTAIFKAGASFRQARFCQEADFRWAGFYGETLFSGPASDERQDSSDEPIFTGTMIDFRQVELNPLDVLTFRNADLREIRLLDTDVREIRFTSVRWPRKQAGVYLFDELDYTGALETRKAAVPWPFRPDQEAQWAKEVPWGKLEGLYRELKQNYETRKDFSQGGDFHYREKEMQRLNPECPQGRQWLLQLYKVLGGYGERIGPPLLSFLALLALCAVAYMLVELSPVEATLHSLQTAFLMRPQFPEGSKVGDAGLFIQTFQTIFSPLFLGLLALSIRQRVKR